MSKPSVLATDLVIGESARWHDGRLWLSNWGGDRQPRDQAGPQIRFTRFRQPPHAQVRKTAPVRW